MAKEKRIGYKRWMPHNIEVIKKKCRHFLVQEVKPQLRVILDNAAQAVLDYIEEMTSLPQYTGNLHDATGVGIYVDGQLSSYVPTKIATRYQSSGFHYRNEYKIDGNLYLQSALRDAAMDFSDGIWIVVFSAVPYAFYIQERPEHYFSEISDVLLQEIYKGLAPLQQKKIPLWV